MEIIDSQLNGDKMKLVQLVVTSLFDFFYLVKYINRRNKSY